MSSRSPDPSRGIGPEAASPSRALRALSGALRLALAGAILAATTSCQRETRQFHPHASAAEAVQGARGGALHAGPAPESAQVAPGLEVGEYQETAQWVSEGQQLFQAFNCSGCHSDGGGGMGANLMDARWYYGHEPRQIFDTIVQGRQNGMPSFAGRLPAYQIWQLVAYVRSLSGLTSPDVASGRNDHMEVRPPPMSMRMRAPLTVRPEPPPDSAKVKGTTQGGHTIRAEAAARSGGGP
jgi:cytochrome c oxidase cbb3-type subunit III